MRRIYEFEIEDSEGNAHAEDNVEVRADNQMQALEKVTEWTRESNAMFRRNDRVRPTPVWISDFVC